MPTDTPDVVVPVGVDDLQAPPPIPVARRLSDAGKLLVPLVVWCAAVCAAVWLWSHEPATENALGLAEVHEVQAAAATDGRVAQVLVQAGDVVEAGQLVAVLDTTALEAELELAKARVAHSRTLVAALEEELRVEREERAAQFAARRAEYESEGRRIRREADRLASAVAVDRAELAGLAPRIARLQPLVGDNLLPAQRHDELLQRRGVLSTRLESYESQLASVREQLEEWERLAPVEVDESDSRARLVPLELELQVQEARVRALELERRESQLRAPASGTVEAVLVREGEFAPVGLSVASIVVPRPGRIAVYAKGAQLETVQVGDTALVRPRDRAATQVEGEVVHVGARTVQLPPELWMMPTVPEWGRLVVVQVDPELALLPGEVQRVSFR